MCIIGKEEERRAVSTRFYLQDETHNTVQYVADNNNNQPVQWSGPVTVRAVRVKTGKQGKSQQNLLENEE